MWRAREGRCTAAEWKGNDSALVTCEVVRNELSHSANLL